MSLWDFIKDTVSQAGQAEQQQATFAPQVYAQAAGNVVEGAVLGLGGLAAGAGQLETSNPYATNFVPQTPVPEQQFTKQALLKTGEQNLASVADPLSYPVQQVQRGITTGLLTVDLATGGGQVNSLRDAWNASRYISPGQEIVASANRFLGDQNAMSPREQVNRAIAAQAKMSYVDGDGNLQNGFQDNKWANFISGTTDASTYLLDPLIWAGKGASVLADAQYFRTATGSTQRFGIFKIEGRAPKLAAEAAAAAEQAGTRSGLGAQIDNILGPEADGSQAMNIAQIQELVGENGWKASNAGDLADAIHLSLKIGSSEAVAATPRELVGHLIASQLGRQESREFIKSQSAILTDALERRVNPLLPAAPVTQELWDQMLLADIWAAKALGESSGFAGTGLNTGLIGAEMGPRNRYMAKVYSDIARERGRLDVVRPGQSDQWVVDTYQISPMARKLSVVNWVGQTKPRGSIVFKNMEVDDAYKEIQSASMDVKSWSPAERLAWRERWAQTVTETDKRNYAQEFNEARVRATLRDELGYEGDGLDDVVNALLKKQKDEVDSYRSNGYYIADDDVNIVHDALLVTQLDNGMPLIDLSHLRRTFKYDSTGYKDLGIAGQAAFRAGRGWTHSIEFVNLLIDNLWKPSILLRGGFAPRNVAESYGRLAGLGALDQMIAEIGPEASYAWAQNRLAGVNSMVVGAARRVGMATDEQLMAAQVRVNNPQLSQTGNFEVTRGRNGEIKLTAVRGEEMPEGMTISQLYAPGKSSNVREVISAERTTQRAVRPSDVRPTTASSWDRADPPVKADYDAQVAAGRLSQKRADSKFEQDTEDFFEAYSRGIQQLMGDPVVRRLVSGEDRDDVLRWFMSSNRDAVALRKRYGLGYQLQFDKQFSKQEIADKFLEIENQAQKFIFGRPLTGFDGLPQEMIEQLATKSFTGAELRAVIGDAALIGPITKQSIESIVGDNSFMVAVMKGRKKVVDYGFKKIGSDVENALVRHPYGAIAYKERVKETMNALDKQGVDVMSLSAAEVSDLERIARLGAVADVKRWIYTIDRYSNGAASLRAFMPFVAASNNTVRTWAAIIGRKPQTLIWAYNLFQAPAKAGIVVDLDEGTVLANDPYALPIIPSGKYGVIMPVPKAFKNLIGLDDRFVLAPPITSLNLVLQGSVPGFPSAGPAVAYATAFFANREPSSFFTQEISKYILPSQSNRGFFPTEEQIPQDEWKAVLPAWLRQYFNKEDPNGIARGTVNRLMLINILQEKAANGQTDPTLTEDDVVEADKRTERLFLIKMFGGGTLPFATNIIDPNQQFLINQFREYGRQGTIVTTDTDPLSPTYNQQVEIDATTRFVNDFGAFLNSKNVAAAYTSSLTQNNSNVNPSVYAQKRLDSYGKDFISTIAFSDPNLIGLLVNDPSGQQDFSSAVYNWQLKNNIPGKGGTYRSYRDPVEAVRESLINQGYRDYINVRRGLQAELEMDGLTTLSQRPEKQALFKQFVASLDAANPDFSNDRKTGGRRSYTNAARGLETIIQNPRVRQESQSNPNAAIPVTELELYLSTRKSFIAQNFPNGYQNGVLDSANKYAPQADAWNVFVNTLIKSSPRFGEVYYRYLDGEFTRPENEGTAVQ